MDPARVAYVADAGETNDLTISSGPSGWVITDQGATITPGSGCASVTAHQVTCSGSALWSVELGDGNEVLQFNASKPHLVPVRLGEFATRRKFDRDARIGVVASITYVCAVTSVQRVVAGSTFEHIIGT